MKTKKYIFYFYLFFSFKHMVIVDSSQSLFYLQKIIFSFIFIYLIILQKLND